MKISNKLTDCESFGFTKKVTRELSQLNNSRFSIAGPICARCLAPIVIPLFSLTDAAFHGLLFTGKGMVGAFVSPYNCLAMAFFPTYKLSKDLEFSSSLIHLMQVVEHLFNATILTLLCVIYPDRADAWMNQRTSETSPLGKLEMERIKQELSSARFKNLHLQAELNEKNENITQLNRSKVHIQNEFNKVFSEYDNKLKTSEEEIVNLRGSLSQTEAKQEEMKNEKIIWENKAHTLQEELMQQKSQFNELQKINERTEKNLKINLQLREKEGKELETKEHDVKQKQEEITRKEKELNEFRTTFGKLSEIREEMTLQIESLEEKVQNLETENSVLTQSMKEHESFLMDAIRVGEESAKFQEEKISLLAEINELRKEMQTRDVLKSFIVVNDQQVK